MWLMVEVRDGRLLLLLSLEGEATLLIATSFRDSKAESKLAVLWESQVLFG